MGDVVYYPRARVELSMRVAGEDVVVPMVPTRMSITRRPHNQAGTCELELHPSALPFDPRQIEDLFVGASFGVVTSADGDIATPSNLRFVGYADKLEPSRGADKAPVVKIECRDLSSLLRDRKPLPPTAVPRYSDTVRGALTRVVEAVVGEALAATPLLRVRDTPEAARLLGPAAPARARNAALHIKPDASAWEVVEHVAALVSCEVFVDIDEIVVRQASTEREGLALPAAELVYGSESGNLLGVDLSKKFQRNRKGVRVVSFDQVARTRVEALYPPDGELPEMRRARAGRRARPGRPERDIYHVREGLTNPEELARLAERIYRERARQELEVSAETPILTPAVLALKNRDRVRLLINPDLAAEVRRAPDRASQFLAARLGLERRVAELLARATLRPQGDRFYVRSVYLNWSADAKSTVKIEMVNLIDTSGAAS